MKGNSKRMKERTEVRSPFPAQSVVLVSQVQMVWASIRKGCTKKLDLMEEKEDGFERGKVMIPKTDLSLFNLLLDYIRVDHSTCEKGK